MPDDPPILAYEPPRPRLRRMHPMLAVVVAHCVASYVVAVGVLTYLRLIVGVSPWGAPGWRWLAAAPARIPSAFLSSFYKSIAQWPRLETAALGWAFVYAAVFAATFMLLSRR